MSSKEQLKVIHTGLDHALDKQAEALPQNFNKHRFLQNCMTVLQDNDFSKCETTSVVRTMLKGAFLEQRVLCNSLWNQCTVSDRLQRGDQTLQEIFYQSD